ncbi:hypothetical protein LLH06_10800 [Mucilaginibacter daejeonensis]|uniref:hypothetical protein n=1 Tax=Mucilaginibacter daejeonensis TaxID=398049 RepID=UPI001D17B915|nr:hypothetical protein [Mucilaginibacter daejeonensis]UEG51462.1 hypothetical protein LLH06_10800 [Mucilaginibacter daejeonensis]
MSFDKYRSQVLEYYKKELAAGRLFFAVPYPTPAKIKTGCLEVLETRYDTKDELFLRSYFRMGNSLEFGPAVRRFDTDKFRPLNSYLRDHSRNPSPEHIELLAWLIDYPGRPYRPSYELTYQTSAEARPTNTGTTATVDQADDLHGSTEVEIPSPVDREQEKMADQASEPSLFDSNGELSDRTNYGRPIRSFWKQKALYALCAMLLFSVGIVFWYVNTTKRTPKTGMVVPVIGQKGCVMWKDDHYEPISCQHSVNGLGSFGINESTVRNLKRITHPDTITPESIKKVWYVKVDGYLEYYTASGFHPIYTERRLKPLTAYMYNKYLFHYADKTKK